MRSRNLEIQCSKLDLAELGVREKGVLEDERMRERHERECMWREEHAIKLRERREREKIERKLLEIERRERNERERVWRGMMSVKRRKEFKMKRRAWSEEMCNRCVEQGLYLATLCVRGKRSLKRILTENG
jgi:hypothetical protein